MISIDKLAYISPLRRVNSLEKFIFSILTMFLCLIFNNIAVSAIVFTLMFFMTVFKGKIPLSSYLKLISIPLAFLIIGIITIAVNIGDNKTYLFSFNVLSSKF